MCAGARLHEVSTSFPSGSHRLDVRVPPAQPASAAILLAWETQSQEALKH